MRSTGEPHAALLARFPDISETVRIGTVGIVAGWEDADLDVARFIWRILGQRRFAEGEPMPGDEFFVAPSEAATRYAETRIPPLRGVLETYRRRIVNGIISYGAREGVDNRELIRRLERDGFGKSRWHRENIARTESSHLYNHGRTARYHASPFVAGYRFEAVLDGRTTEICEGLHGREFEKGEVGGLQPPLHFQCRSHLMPIFAGEEAKFESREELITDETRPLPGFGNIDASSLPKERDLRETYAGMTDNQRAALQSVLDGLRAAA